MASTMRRTWAGVNERAERGGNLDEGHGQHKQRTVAGGFLLYSFCVEGVAQMKS